MKQLSIYMHQSSRYLHNRKEPSDLHKNKIKLISGFTEDLEAMYHKIAVKVLIW